MFLVNAYSPVHLRNLVSQGIDVEYSRISDYRAYIKAYVIKKKYSLKCY